MNNLIIFHQVLFAQTHLLQNGRQRATLAQSTPSRDRRVFANEQLVTRRQAYRRYVGREGERRLEPHERQVVLEGEEVVLGMDDLLRDAALHVRQSLLHGRKVVLAHPDADLRCQQAARRKIYYWREVEV